MRQENETRQQDSRRKFLRLVGILWVAAVLATLVGALIAPHLGRMADFVLHQTVHRHWTRLALQTEQPFLDLSAPAHTIKSYYSALYRGDATAMERLTAGPFRDQMRLRLAHAESSSSSPPYRSYLRTETSAAQSAAVVEKFHLFWQRGLRFSLQRNAADWCIIGVEMMP
jgi:hypothetical protein